MQLSKNFHLSELITSQAAKRFGISNQPNSAQIANLKSLCEKILQPVRDHYQKPVIVSSGYRSPMVNAKIGGSKTSQHCSGLAVDFEIPGLANKQVAQWIRENLEYDQLILEFYDGKDPNSGWIHCSYVAMQRGLGGLPHERLHQEDKNRKQALIYNGGRYQAWA